MGDMASNIFYLFDQAQQADTCAVTSISREENPWSAYNLSFLSWDVKVLLLNFDFKGFFVNFARKQNKDGR